MPMRNIKPADIIIVNSGTTYGQLIMMALSLFQADDVKYIHVLMAVDEKEAIVAESKVRYRNIEKYLSKVKSYKIIRNNKLTDEQREKIVERSKKLFNLKYGVFRIVLQLLDQVFSTDKFTNWLDDRKIQVCSTVPSWSYYVEAGIKFNGLPWQCVEPDDIDDESISNTDDWDIVYVSVDMWRL
jgi:hypothetical protein